MMEQNKVFVGIIEINEAKRISSILQEKNVDIEMHHNKESCVSGCKVTVEVWCDEKNITEVINLFQKEQLKLLEGLNVNYDQINQVFDENSKKAICPACGITFSTSSKECPDCGLNFSG